MLSSIGKSVWTSLPEAVFHSPKVQLVGLSDQLFVVVFLILPLVGQIFSPLDSSAARFRSPPAGWAGSSREDSLGAEGLRYTNSRLPSIRLLVAIRVFDTTSSPPKRFRGIPLSPVSSLGKRQHSQTPPPDARHEIWIIVWGLRDGECMVDSMSIRAFSLPYHAVLMLSVPSMSL